MVWPVCLEAWQWCVCVAGCGGSEHPAAGGLPVVCVGPCFLCAQPGSHSAPPHADRADEPSPCHHGPQECAPPGGGLQVSITFWQASLTWMSLLNSQVSDCEWHCVTISDADLMVWIHMYKMDQSRLQHVVCLYLEWIHLFSIDMCLATFRQPSIPSLPAKAMPFKWPWCKTIPSVRWSTPADRRRSWFCSMFVLWQKLEMPKVMSLQ